MFEDERKILAAEIWKLSPPAQSATKKIFSHLDKEVITNAVLEFIGSLPALPMSSHDVSQELIAQLNDAVETLRNNPAVWLSRKNLPHEIWHDAVGYAGHYQISNYGRAKSLKRGRQEILREVRARGNYACVALFKNNERKNFSIHQLVAQAFIENPDAKPEVHHRNNHKRNNCVWNLEWTTPEENMNYARQSGLMKGKQGADNPFAKLTAEDVRYIRKVYIPRHPNFGATALAEKFHVNRQILYDAIHYRTYKNVR